MNEAQEELRPLTAILNCGGRVEHSSSSQPSLCPHLGYPDLHRFPLPHRPSDAPPQNRETLGRKGFLPVEPASCLSFLFLLGKPRFA
jgi:hypothetical protein